MFFESDNVSDVYNNDCGLDPLFSPGKVIVSEKVYRISQDDEDFTDKMVVCLFDHSCNSSPITDKAAKYNNSINIKDNKGMVLNKYSIDEIEYTFITYLHPTFKEPAINELYGHKKDDEKIITTHVMLTEEY